MKNITIKDVLHFVRRAIRAYPYVATTITVGVIGLLLLLTPARSVAPWIVGVYALVIAAIQAYGMAKELLHGNAGLDILAVTAIVSATLVGEPWAALVVVLMITGGEALEDYAQNRSKRELTALLKRAPQTATLLIKKGREEHTKSVAVSKVKRGDIIIVRSGEIVPVDAELLETAALFDESSVTGESLPVERKQGEIIMSGVVNGQTAARLRATALAADSQYQQIVRLVKQAQDSKAPMVRLADRYAVPFTLLSLAIAITAWIMSGDPTRFAEVLVVATPCPLLIAAPVAFLGGINRAAKAGLIVKSGGTLEQLARVKSVAFDKTGTLTTGQPKPLRIDTKKGFTENQVLSLAASAEAYSSHVLASAVVSAAKQRQQASIAVSSAEEYATNGVEAHTNQGVIRVGKPSWIAKFAPDITRAEQDTGQTAIYISLDGHHAGTIIMRDELRQESAEIVATLKMMDISHIAMVTGDLATTAKPLAKKLGIRTLHAECTPADKVSFVAAMKPRPLMMVGDGLNDAPVLAAADVGFAMGARGATAASESADIVNRADSIRGIPVALQIGRDTVRIALQSIWTGIIISTILMGIAAFGSLPALAGAWLQEGVDLVAILWALRAARTTNK